MDLEDKIKATAKNIGGKVQEAVGEMIGDPEIKAKGQIKQAEAEAQINQSAEEEPETPTHEKEEEIEQLKTFEGDTDKIEQATSFEEAKNRSSQ